MGASVVAVMVGFSFFVWRQSLAILAGLHNPTRFMMVSVQIEPHFTVQTYLSENVY